MILYTLIKKGVVLISREKEFLLTSDNLKEIKEQLIMELLKTRKKAKVTQVQLSNMSGLPQATISRFESLERDMTLQTLIKYAEALNVEISFVLKEKDSNIKKLNKKTL